MKKIKILIMVTCTALLVFGMISGASALSISIDPTSFSGTKWAGDQTSQNKINEVIGPIMGYAPELYKQNVGGSEEGPFANFYTTEFNTDVSAGTITWDGDAYIKGEPLYLLVKDGRNNPAWYLFRLNDFDLTAPFGPYWDGKGDINLSGFWPGNGGISHVSIYGKTTSAPEPATLILLGMGLLGIAGIRRRK